MFKLKINHLLCQNINQVHLYLIYYGRGVVDNKWHDKVLNPIYSRLIYIASGTGLITINNNENIVLEPGNWYLIPAGCSFEYSCDDKMDHLYIHFRLCDHDGIDLFNQSPFPSSIKGYEKDIDFLTTGLDSYSIYESLKIRQKVYDILLDLIDKNKILLEVRDFSLCVKKAIKFIQENLSTQLSVKRIAEHCQICSSTLNKHFKEELFMSVSAYIDNLVFHEATKLLKETDLSIMNISEQLGFCDQFYFSRRFKEKMGTPPQQYRKIFK